MNKEIKVGKSAQNFVQNSVLVSVYDSVCYSVCHSVRDSVKASVWNEERYKKGVLFRFLLDILKGSIK